MFFLFICLFSFVDFKVDFIFYSFISIALKQEMNKFQTILLDQASCIILKNITSFIRTEIKGVKEQRTHFAKVSETYDAALTRNAQANKNRAVDVNDAVNTLSATSSCFRHMALDYVYALTTLQSKKMHEVLSTVNRNENYFYTNVFNK